MLSCLYAVRTGRAHVLRPLLRAVLVCRLTDGFGPRVFAIAFDLSELCLWLGLGCEQHGRAVHV